MTIEKPQGEQIIYAPGGTRYLAEKMKDLPMNCLFDKGKTGCGGTTIALCNEQNYIILVPMVNLIKNKLAQTGKDSYEIFGVHAGVCYEEFADYCRRVWGKKHPLKIMSTYDSFLKTGCWLESLHFNPYDNAQVLVDEYHMLAYWYKLKPHTMREVMSNAAKYDNKCFMTATPLHGLSLLRELEDYPTVKVEWEETEQKHIRLIPVRSVQKSLTELVRQNYTEHITGETDINLHIFINSVNTSVKIAYDLDIPPEHVRIVCSENDEKNIYKAGKKYKIETMDTQSKIINFYTATAFCGADIYDENGVTVIASDAYKQHTLLDVSTMIPQIMGRIRNSRYKDHALHIFSENRYDRNNSEEEYLASIKEDFEQAENYAEDINKMSPDNIRKTYEALTLSGNLRNDCIVLGEDGKVYADENILRIDLVNYYLRKSYTTQGLRDSYTAENFTIHVDEDVQKEIGRLASSAKNRRYSFKDAFLEYADAVEQYNEECKEKGISPDFSEFNKGISHIWRDHQCVIDAYQLLGREKVEKLGYNTKYVDRELIKCSDKPPMAKIVEMLEKEITTLPQVRFDNEIRKILAEINRTLGIPKPAKVTDIDKYYFCKHCNGSVNDKKGRYTRILSPKSIIL